MTTDEVLPILIRLLHRCTCPGSPAGAADFGTRAGGPSKGAARRAYDPRRREVSVLIPRGRALPLDV